MRTVVGWYAGPDGPARLVPFPADAEEGGSTVAVQAEPPEDEFAGWCAGCQRARPDLWPYAGRPLCGACRAAEEAGALAGALARPAARAVDWAVRALSPPDDPNLAMAAGAGIGALVVACLWALVELGRRVVAGG